MGRVEIQWNGAFEAARVAVIHSSTQSPSLPKSLIIKAEAYGLVTARAQRYLLNIFGILFSW